MKDQEKENLDRASGIVCIFPWNLFIWYSAHPHPFLANHRATTFNMYTQRFSLIYLFALLCISSLAAALTAWESIHQTLHTYPLAIDAKDFGLLSKVR